MNILIISPQIPFPLVDGAKRAIYYPIKGLAERGHKVTLLCLSQSKDEEAIRELSRYCTLEVFVHSKERTVTGALSSMFRKTPYFLNRFHVTPLLEQAFQHLHGGGFDIVHLETLHCAYYGLEIRRRFDIPIVLRLHNVESMILSRFAAHQSNLFLKAYAALEATRVERYEKEVWPQFDKLFTISGEDERVVRSLSTGARTATYPAGVDLDHFTPDHAHENDNTILWMGALQWPPNRDSFWWFVREIIPIILSKRPGIRFSIVGSNPPDEIRTFRHPNVEVAGFVQDVRTPVAEATVAVVPLRIGGGIRLKLLELFAMEKAVVSTAIGCEGLGVRDGEELSIADSADQFAGAVVRLLDDRAKRTRLGANARRHVEQHFSWSSVVEAYEKEYSALTVLRKASA